MKANQAFLYEEEEAVSPVIGVILMVAITVVLAAVVFVLVQDLGQGAGTTAPNVGFQKSESNDQITVTKTETGVKWSDYQIRSDQSTEIFVNVTGDVGNGATNQYDVKFTNSLVSLNATANIQASDYLEFCGESAVSDVTITLVHEESGSIAQTYEFSSIAECTDLSG